jgi:hypothetical protein
MPHFPAWADLPEENRAIVRAAADSLVRQARARQANHKPPKLTVPGSQAHWKLLLVNHYLPDLRAEVAP